MKKLSILFTWLSLVGVAAAAPYVVYSGPVTVTFPVSAKGTIELYVITDLADTSKFDVLQFDSKERGAAITAYPQANQSSFESNLNFFGSVDGANGGSSMAV